MTHIEVDEISYEEGRALFDKQCRRLLGISADDFLERYDAGDWDGHHDPHITSLEFLIPFARPSINDRL